MPPNAPPPTGPPVIPAGTPPYATPYAPPARRSDRARPTTPLEYEHALRGPRPRDFAALRRRLLEAVQPDRRGKVPPKWKQARLSAATRLVDQLQSAVEAATAVFASRAETPSAAMTTGAR